MAEGTRLNKYMAQAGLCSRREADRYIEAGQVYINGRQAEIGQCVFPGDKVRIGAKDIRSREEKVVLAWYKPAGVTCTEKDPHAKKKIGDVFQYPVRVTYAGRLDKDSEGLLLMTNDGDLIERLMRGANGHEKEYIVKVDKPVTEALKEKLEKGIYLEALKQTTRPCRVTIDGTYTFHIVLTQGLNRQIRRMCEACGYRVQSLKRIRVANVRLEKLKPGEYRVLSAEEREALYQGCERPKKK